MGELVYKPKKGRNGTVVVTGNDGGSFSFPAGIPVDADQVPEDVRAAIKEGVGVNIAPPAPEPADDEPKSTSRGGK